MRKLVEIFIYLAGVVFFSWNYYKLKDALDFASLLTLSIFYLAGVSTFATFLSRKIDTLFGDKDRID